MIKLWYNSLVENMGSFICNETVLQRTQAESQALGLDWRWADLQGVYMRTERRVLVLSFLLCVREYGLFIPSRSLLNNVTEWRSCLLMRTKRVLFYLPIIYLKCLLYYCSSVLPIIMTSTSTVEFTQMSSCRSDPSLPLDVFRVP